MISRNLCNPFSPRPIHIIGGSKEFFVFSLYGADLQNRPTAPLNISDVTEIEWSVAPFSVIEEKKRAVIRKRLTTEEIVIIHDGSDGEPNEIRVHVEPKDTQYLHGTFLFQTAITDGAGNTFRPRMWSGVISVDAKIQQ